MNTLLVSRFDKRQMRSTAAAMFGGTWGPGHAMSPRCSRAARPLPRPSRRPTPGRNRRASSCSTRPRRSCGMRRRASPLLIVLDDLHAADTPSILLLRFVASQMADMRVLLVGTYRDVELTPDHPLTAALAEVAREPITRIARAGAACRSMPSTRSSARRADVAPHDHLVAAVWRETNGNPLFVGEAVRLLSAEGRLNDLADLPSLTLVVPAGVRAVIARRVGQPQPGLRRMLGLAAALGPEFSLEVLRRIGDLEGDRATGSHRRSRRGGSAAAGRRRPRAVSVLARSRSRDAVERAVTGSPRRASIGGSPRSSRRSTPRRSTPTSPSSRSTTSRRRGATAEPARMATRTRRAQGDRLRPAGRRSGRAVARLRGGRRASIGWRWRGWT